MRLGSEIASLFEQCIVRIYGAAYAGTGFFVAPGVVLTCAHVARDAGAEPEVDWEGHRLRVAQVIRIPPDSSRRFYDFPDLGVLRIAEAPQHPCVLLADQNPPTGSAMFARGFSKEIVEGVVGLDGLMVTIAAPNGGYLRVKGDQIVRGLSGSPIIDPATGRVCGLVKGSRDTTDERGGWIVPVSAIHEHLGDLVRWDAVEAAPWLRALGELQPFTADLVAPPPPDFRSLSLNPPLELRPVFLHGRDALVADLIKIAAAPDGVLHILNGLGGVGKSAIALEVAAGVSERGGSDVFWIRASSGTALPTWLLAIAQARGANPAELRQAAAAQMPVATLLSRYLTGGRPWLIVLDDADDPQALATRPGGAFAASGWWPPGRHGLVLVTSRSADRRQWGPRAILHCVDSLPPDDGSALLRDLAPQAGDEAGARALSARLGGLALALRAAGAYLAAEPAGGPETFEAYQRTLDERFESIVDAGTRLEAGDEAVARELVLQTWDLSLDQLAARGLPETREMLELLAAFGPALIPDAMLSVSNLPPEIREDEEVFTTALPKAEKCLNGLKTFSLIDTIRSGPSHTRCWHLHPLVREVTRLHTTCPTTSQMWSATLLTFFFGTLDHKMSPESWPTWDLAAAHLLPVARDLGQNPGPGDASFAYDLTRMHLPLLLEFVLTASAQRIFAGRHVDAADLLDSAANLAREQLPADHPIHTKIHEYEVRSLLRAGKTARAQAEFTAGFDEGLHITLLMQRGRLDEAEQRLRDLMHTSECDVQVLRHKLGVLLRIRGRPEESLTELSEVLSQAREQLGATHPVTMVSWEEYAGALGDLGRHAEAEREHRTLLAARQETLGEEHPHTIKSRYLLTGYLTEDPERQESELRAVLEVQTKTLDADHSDICDTKLDLARLLRDSQRYSEADVLVRQVLARHTTQLGMRASETLSAWHELADLLRCQGFQEAAARELRAVLRARVRVLGPLHKDTAMTHFVLAQLLDSDDDEAREHFRAALSGFSRYESGAPPAAYAWFELVAWHARHGGFAEAEQDLRDLLADPSVSSPTANAHIRLELAETILAQGRPGEAAVDLSELLPSCREIFGPEHAVTQHAQALLAQAQEILKKDI